jgi:hypothetical protein
MIFNSEKLNRKFNREIKALESLATAKDQLSHVELLAIKEKVLKGLLARPETASAPYFWRTKFSLGVRWAVSVLVGVSLVGGTAFASNSALPGSPLYPVKRATEKVAVTLAPGEENKANLQASFAQRRLNELHELSARVNKNNPNRNFLNASTTKIGQNIIGSASSTEIQNGGNSKDKELHAQAKAEANSEVKTALINLKRVREKLNAKGNSKAAESVQNNILRLQESAKAEHVNGEDENNEGLGNGSNGQDRGGEVKGSNIKNARPESGKAKNQFQADAQNRDILEESK